MVSIDPVSSPTASICTTIGGKTGCSASGPASDSPRRTLSCTDAAARRRTTLPPVPPTISPPRPPPPPPRRGRPPQDDVARRLPHDLQALQDGNARAEHGAEIPGEPADR